MKPTRGSGDSIESSTTQYIVRKRISFNSSNSSGGINQVVFHNQHESVISSHPFTQSIALSGAVLINNGQIGACTNNIHNNAKGSIAVTSF